MAVLTISKFQSLCNGGILADIPAQATQTEFRRFNLIYGFNGAGKSTLSRIFSSLKSGGCNAKLPADCSFKFAFSDGSTATCPGNSVGLEDRLKIFNSDFVDENLQWNLRRAKPIFYIGQEQAQIAAELEKVRQKIASTAQAQESAEKVCKGHEKTFVTFKKERARSVAGSLKEQGRKYEAPQLVADIQRFGSDTTVLLSEEQLKSAVSICSQNEPLQPLATVSLDCLSLLFSVRTVMALLKQSPSVLMLQELQYHPSMVMWTRDGLKYHEAHSLESCLFCGGPLTPSRLDLLKQSLDTRLEGFLAEIDSAVQVTGHVSDEINGLRQKMLTFGSTSSDLSTPLHAGMEKLKALLSRAEELLEISGKSLEAKRLAPTRVIETQTVLSDDDVRVLTDEIASALDTVNFVVKKHNQRVSDFNRTQTEARLMLRKHYAREAEPEYSAFETALMEGEKVEAEHSENLGTLRKREGELKSQLQKHGPAADKINKLIASYLGHKELTISAVTDGYEIHRHGNLLTGPPSEGEKTAVALCYFLSTLEANGAKVKDSIVVVDDPISSLDTKALNFACSMVKSRTTDVAQLFLLTHNQSFMREFVKAWRNKSKDEPPTAAFFFLDVALQKGQTQRSARLGALPKFLRDYDFEYHFLFHHVLRFEAATNAGEEYDHAYMMPNVMRRVLDVFLAFRCPGASGFAGKIDQLCRQYPAVDADRLYALEKLVQAESHSDSLDDLISLSSMTVEESRDAMQSLLKLMQEVDHHHLEAIRKLCR